MEYQLAEINVAKMIGINIDDPIMKEFADNLETINILAENSEGFIWRLKDDHNNATSINPFDDVQIIINISVWTDVDKMKNFIFKTFHSDFLRRRKEWFQNYGQVSTAMWWIPAGDYPTVEMATNKLEYLQKNGASQAAFDFKKVYQNPSLKI